MPTKAVVSHTRNSTDSHSFNCNVGSRKESHRLARRSIGDSKLDDHVYLSRREVKTWLKRSSKNQSDHEYELEALCIDGKYYFVNLSALNDSRVKVSFPGPWGRRYDEIIEDVYDLYLAKRGEYSTAAGIKCSNTYPGALSFSSSPRARNDPGKVHSVRDGKRKRISQRDSETYKSTDLHHPFKQNKNRGKVRKRQEHVLLASCHQVSDEDIEEDVEEDLEENVAEEGSVYTPPPSPATTATPSLSPNLDAPSNTAWENKVGQQVGEVVAEAFLFNRLALEESDQQRRSSHFEQFRIGGDSSPEDLIGKAQTSLQEIQRAKALVGSEENLLSMEIVLRCSTTVTVEEVLKDLTEREENEETKLRNLQMWVTLERRREALVDKVVQDSLQLVQPVLRDFVAQTMLPGTWRVDVRSTSASTSIANVRENKVGQQVGEVVTEAFLLNRLALEESDQQRRSSHFEQFRIGGDSSPEDLIGKAQTSLQEIQRAKALVGSEENLLSMEIVLRCSTTVTVEEVLKDLTEREENEETKLRNLQMWVTLERRREALVDKVVQDSLQLVQPVLRDFIAHTMT